MTSEGLRRSRLIYSFEDFNIHLLSIQHVYRDIIGIMKNEGL